MRRRIDVLLGDEARLVGTLYYNNDDGRESAAFEYARAWLENGDRFALEPALPLVTGPQYRRRPNREASVFPAAIADTEPDGWAKRVILRDQAKRRAAGRTGGRQPPSPVLTALDFLLAVDDESRTGALRYRDEEGVFLRAEGTGRRTPPLLELQHLVTATRAVEQNTETAQDLTYLRGRGTPVGGLRPKCSIRDEDGTLAIGKFPSVTDERAVTKAEVLALQLAAAAGISAASARLIDSDGSPVALIRRFDRGAGGRIPYLSAASLLGAEPGESTPHSYRELADALRIHSVQTREDQEELWRRVAFSILITNTDDHLHNHGFLHVEGELWRLAPAFDLNPSPDRARELQTWITEESGPAASIEALWDAAPLFQIPQDRARAILHQVESAVGRWRQKGRSLGMSPGELESFADAFEHEERAAARRHSRPTR